MKNKIINIIVLLLIAGILIFVDKEIIKNDLTSIKYLLLLIFLVGLEFANRDKIE